MLPLHSLPSRLLSVQLFLLEELRERKYDHYARTIQKAWRRYKADQYYFELKKKGKHYIQGASVGLRGNLKDCGRKCML